MWFGKQVGIQEADKVCESVVIPVMRGRGEEKHMIRMGRESLGQLVALGLLNLVPT